MQHKIGDFEEPLGMVGQVGGRLLGMVARLGEQDAALVPGDEARAKEDDGEAHEAEQRGDLLEREATD